MSEWVATRLILEACESNGGGRPSEGHVKSDFVSGNGAAETGIMVAWQYQGVAGHC